MAFDVRAPISPLDIVIVSAVLQHVKHEEVPVVVALVAIIPCEPSAQAPSGLLGKRTFHVDAGAVCGGAGSCDIGWDLLGVRDE